jgi:MFS family permease
VGATLVAFLGGWGYQGLVLLATARTNPASPAAALAIVRIGPNAGAVIGPLIFGAIVERAGYGVAWGFAAAASLGAALLVLVGRSLLVPVRRRIVAARDARQEPR